MQIKWRALLDSLRIAWVDRGPNTSRGRVNIKCPFCGNDPGFHMSLAEDYEAFYCWRDGRHGGRRVSYLLGKLGVAPREAKRLLALYGLGAPNKPGDIPERTPITARPSDCARSWEQFNDASSAPHIVDYLVGRGFPEPHTTATRYDLRYAYEGRWAQRLLIPIAGAFEVFGWTGRAVRPGATPKYLTELDRTAPSALYIPRTPRAVVYIVEGPLDALKLCVATEHQDTSAVALCGKSLSSDKTLHLRGLLQQSYRGRPYTMRLCPDADTTLSYRVEFLAWGRALHPTLCDSVTIHTPPDPYKDVGAMPIPDVQRWVGDC